MAVMISAFGCERKNNFRLEGPLSDEVMINQMLEEREIDPMCSFVPMASEALSHTSTTSYVFACDAKPNSESLYRQLNQLREYQQKLKQAARTVTLRLQSLDTGLWKYDAPHDVAQTDGPEGWSLSTSEPNTVAPCLQLAFTQGPLFFGSIQEDVWAFIVSVDRKVSESLRDWQRQLNLALLQVNRAVAVILHKIAGSGTGFFCGMRWERRRWFLRHGARPPKIRLAAISSLFPEACLGL